MITFKEYLLEGKKEKPKKKEEKLPIYLRKQSGSGTPDKDLPKTGTPWTLKKQAW